MARISNAHFGGNIVLTVDDLHNGAPYVEMNQEVSFYHFRYPGGTVTEQHTWENGGLNKIFGPPIDPGSTGHVVTVREALQYAMDQNAGITIVIPTAQFLEKSTGEFDYDGFGRYLRELEQALREYPDARITDFEIGNEYWAWLTPAEYGQIANEQIPLLDSLRDRLSVEIAGWTPPGIGLQAGVNWDATKNPDGTTRPLGPDHSRQIAAQIDIGHREMVDTIFQHSYPNPARKSMDWQVDWALDPMREYQNIGGFRTDLKFSLSEFNVARTNATGVEQGAVWIEEFGARIDAGIDEFMHWGLSYDVLSNKFYDNRFPYSGSDGGSVVTKATPMGQVYDLASAHLPGMSTVSDGEAVKGMRVSGGMTITGFSDDDQKMVFFYNGTSSAGEIDLRQIGSNRHLSISRLADADSPFTPRYDESIPDEYIGKKSIDARGDMQTLSGSAVSDVLTLARGEMVVVTATERGADLKIEGAHNVTNAASGMVNDVIIGGTGNDTLRGHIGNDKLHGSAGRDVVAGGKGNDTIKGGAGDDILFAGQGSDRVIGGDGRDLVILSGGKPGDRADIRLGDGADTLITGSGQNVVIRDFSSDDFLAFNGGFSNPSDLRNATRTDGKDLVIEVPGGGLIRFVGAADMKNSLVEHVLYFQEPVHVTRFGEALIEEMSYEQIRDFFDLLGMVDDPPQDVTTGLQPSSGPEDIMTLLGFNLREPVGAQII